MTVPDQADARTTPHSTPIVIVVHGGAGTIRPEAMRPDLELRYRAGIEAALAAGHRLLRSGGSALDAAVAAVQVLEDDPFFNAGRGSVFADDGSIEMDACVMEGWSGRAGAVAAVRTIRHPVLAARAVMDRTEHVLLGGPAAEHFAAAQGLAPVDPAHFFTSARWEQWLHARDFGRIERDHDSTGHPMDDPINDPMSTPAGASAGRVSGEAPRPERYGTVGAVARDAEGRLAAATSTGGLTNKMSGRIGDSAQVGAGTFADDTVAVSGTGTGEFFMRGLLAYDVSARMRYLGLGLAEAVDQTIEAGLTRRQGGGGLIAVDARGAVRMAFNTTGMYRGIMGADAQAKTGIFRGPETAMSSSG